MALAQQQKPPNGQAQSGSYLLVFDLDDEAQAWEVAQQLASQRKLKQVLVGMLLAVHTVQEQTGKVLDLLQFMAAFITGQIHGGNGNCGPVRITEATALEELPSIFTGAEDHADPVKAWQNFSARMGDLFSDDEWN